MQVRATQQCHGLCGTTATALTASSTATTAAATAATAAATVCLLAGLPQLSDTRQVPASIGHLCPGGWQQAQGGGEGVGDASQQGHLGSTELLLLLPLRLPSAALLCQECPPAPSSQGSQHSCIAQHQGQAALQATPGSASHSPCGIAEGHCQQLLPAGAQGSQLCCLAPPQAHLLCMGGSVRLGGAQGASSPVCQVAPARGARGHVRGDAHAQGSKGCSQGQGCSHRGRLPGGQEGQGEHQAAGCAQQAPTAALIGPPQQLPHVHSQGLCIQGHALVGRVHAPAATASCCCVHLTGGKGAAALQVGCQAPLREDLTQASSQQLATGRAGSVQHCAAHAQGQGQAAQPGQGARGATGIRSCTQQARGSVGGQEGGQGGQALQGCIAQHQGQRQVRAQRGAVQCHQRVQKTQAPGAHAGHASTKQGGTGYRGSILHASQQEGGTKPLSKHEKSSRRC